MPYLVCGLPIRSEKNLEQVAELISQRLFRGIPFVGKEEHFYDEVPAVRAKHHVLGLRIVLQGFGGDQGYYLEMHPSGYPENREAAAKVLNPDLDITAYIAFLLSDIPEIQIGQT